jgi:hypothetical protein
MRLQLSARVIAVVALPATSAPAAKGDMPRDFVFGDPRR